ncbi:type II toxin-antitoxin system TacA family antitoxin [Photorhabdus sp. SF281]|uniref:type II toxin-antitoxin system TacA family antitoxin n=1 Tax=Photorhabdus sp. SF281 TaxID=3459527 RepID=UPI0040449190
MMTATARFNLKMDTNEKEIISHAAALMGTTMAAFVHTAAKEKARELLDRDFRITMTAQDFQAFTTALNDAFTPNAALQNAINDALSTTWHITDD